MICPNSYLEFLLSKDIEFFSGVPDSLLRNFCNCIADQVNESSHVITANEGAAVGLSLGYYLGTGKIPLVYMQNSGLGNIVNPILSLASSEVYGVPMLLMIGWRGKPGEKDEPQHIHQGRILLKMLDVLDIPYVILSGDLDKAKYETSNLIEKSKKESRPTALVINNDLFETYTKLETKSFFEITRDQAICTVASSIDEDSAIVATTGMASRELFEYRSTNNLGHQKDFLTVGGMGHASQIALGLAMKQPNRTIYCLDGDGAALMHLGSLGISGQSNCKNFVHVVLNNGVHGSVGGQPTIGFNINFCDIAKSCGYVEVFKCSTEEEIISALKLSKNVCGPSFVEIQISNKNKKGIGRPTSTPKENKINLMKYLGILK